MQIIGDTMHELDFIWDNIMKSSDAKFFRLPTRSPASNQDSYNIRTRKIPTKHHRPNVYHRSHQLRVGLDLGAIEV